MTKKTPPSHKVKHHTRKSPCEVCGVSTGARHRVSCQWAHISRPTKHAQRSKLSPAQKTALIKRIHNL